MDSPPTDIAARRWDAKESAAETTPEEMLAAVLRYVREDAAADFGGPPRVGIVMLEFDERVRYFIAGSSKYRRYAGMIEEVKVHLGRGDA